MLIYIYQSDMSINCQCPLCSSDKYEFLFNAKDNLGITDKSFDLVKCKSCGVTRLLSPPDEDEIQKYYPECYFKGEPQIDFPLNKRKKLILEKYISKGRILDYGCGDCSFLLSLDDRWEKFGYDKKLYTEETILEKNKIKFMSGSLIETNIQNEYFDAITFWASIEHTHNPANILKFAYDKLKTGGKLIILCQNIDSIQGKLFKKHWLHLDVPRHIYQFSTRTLETTLKKNNIKVIEVVHNNPEYNIPGFTDSLKLFFNSTKGVSKTNIQASQYEGVVRKTPLIKRFLSYFILYFFAYPLAFIEVLIRKGGIITVVAEK
ncbi:class I SAM-dependent methyltransferase [bacterium]|nr:class I SAM-dependent methyltransferase [bacterium]